ncbi:MAG: hypothetical protein KAH18_03850, partial [Psychromonas sp.]|nr:hypothetical protein [Psychromonas sp.]
NKKVINKKTVSASKAQLKPKKAEINLSLSLGKQIDELKASLSLMSEKLINNNQKNKILKIKVQKLTDEIKNLNDQLTSEIMRYDKLTSSNNEYRKKLESIVPSTFSGGGILNAILHFLSSSIIYLVVTLLLPIILLIIIFILRKKNKRLLDEQEQKVIETNVFNEEVGVEPSVINEEVGVEPSVINEDVKVEPSVLKEEEEQVEPSESKKEESLEPSESKKEESLEPSVINEDVKVEPSVLKEEEEQVEPNESKKEESLEPTLSTDEDSKLLDNENTDPLWDSDVSEDTSEIIDLDENDGGVSENDLDLSDLDELDTLGDIALHELQKEISDIDPDTEEDPNSSELEIVDTDVFDTLASQTIKNDEFEIQEDDSADLDSVDSASEDPADLELDAFDEELPFNEDLALESSGTNEEDPFIDIDALLENGDSNVNNDDLGFTLEGKENDVLELSEIEDTNDEPGFNEDITIPNIAADEHDALIDIDALFEESGGDVNNDVAGSASEGIKDEDFESLEAGEANDDENSISSKLNLARAYLEIDDKSGAKEILDGIGDKCTAKQRKEINKLLKKYS